MRLLWLPEVLRAAGLTVHEVSGWRTRGSDSFGPVRGITIHETRGSVRSTDAGEIYTLIHGSATAPPPIAPLYLSRTGHWHVVASGTCFHNKVGWDGPNEGYGNDSLLGIEAQHALGEPWTDRQYDSYVRGVAALARKLDVPVSRVAGHKEHQPGSKTDPSFNMDQFRRDVAAGGDDVSAEDVITGMSEPVPWQSTGVGRWARSQGMGDEVSSRALLEYSLSDNKALLAQQAVLLANVAELRGKDFVDEQRVVDGVLAGLGGADLDDAAAALRAAFGDRIGELAAKLATPQG
ncbi:N-acetylmuramoyl-L-alanine amidase [Micromonosporaceae bacterium B7E4]